MIIKISALPPLELHKIHIEPPSQQELSKPQKMFATAMFCFLLEVNKKNSEVGHTP
jgi:hypothetical protein